MGAAATRMPWAGLAFILTVIFLTSAAAAAGARAAANGNFNPHLKHHAHIPRMQPAEQKLQSMLQEQNSPRSVPPHSKKAQQKQQQQARAQQVVPVGPLLPACVPKYVTDLVLPPPMPVSIVPLSQKQGMSPQSTKATVMQTEEGTFVNVDEYEHPTHVHLASADGITAEQKAKLRKKYTADEEYYASWYDSDLYDAPKKDKKKQAEEVKEDRVAAPAPAPAAKDAPKADNPEAEQVPPPLPVFHSYDVSVRQISQAVLPAAPVAGLAGCPANFAPTNVLAYGPANIAGTPFHNWPGFTIEAQRNVPTHIRWTNDLKDAAGNFLPHILRDSIDQTLHWANPAALGGSIDSNPCHMCAAPGLFNCPTIPDCVTAATTTYTGPIPIVTHVHGQTSVYDWADGYTEAWYLPAANNLAGYTPVGTWYNQMQAGYTTVTGQTWTPGSNTGIFTNTQRATTLWYHDHALGLTRTNVFAGMAGLYMIRDKFPSIANGPELPGLPYPAYDGIIPLDLVREIPIAIQDRSFTTDSQLWYPVANNPPGSTLPNGPLHPRWIPEYSATVADPVTGVLTNMLMMTVNGRTYPRHTVYPDAYRLRILNGCNSRVMQLRFGRSTQSAIDPLPLNPSVNPSDVNTLVPFWVVGSDDGFWPTLSAPMTTLQLGPAERYDVVIDFSRLNPGEYVYLLNNGPETDTAIYNGFNNGLGLTVHTAQIMRFDVFPLPPGQTARPFTLADQVALNAAMIAEYAATVPPIAPVTPPRQVSLLEERDAATGVPIATLLGTATNNANGINTATPQLWMDPVTANSPSNADSVWDIINLTPDSHPIHLHNVAFEYLGRFQLIIDPVNPNTYTKTDLPVPNQDLDELLVVPCPVTLNPTGKCRVEKDTQLLLPGTYTRIQFKAPNNSGLYVWHCHLVEHEDNEMMVPHCFGVVPYLNPKTGLPMCPGPNRAGAQTSDRVH